MDGSLITLGFEVHVGFGRPGMMLNQPMLKKTDSS